MLRRNRRRPQARTRIKLVDYFLEKIDVMIEAVRDTYEVATPTISDPHQSLSECIAEFGKYLDADAALIAELVINRLALFSTSIQKKE
jgi:hypothetical protein